MARNYKEEYQHWLDSPALSEEEWAELNAIADDEKEIENRFFAPLEFGTAGLRGTMKLGLHHMNVHIIRHATQAFANVISAEGEEAKRKGIAWSIIGNFPEKAKLDEIAKYSNYNVQPMRFAEDGSLQKEEVKAPPAPKRRFR